MSVIYFNVSFIEGKLLLTLDVDYISNRNSREGKQLIVLIKPY